MLSSNFIFHNLGSSACAEKFQILQLIWSLRKQYLGLGLNSIHENCFSLWTSLPAAIKTLLFLKVAITRFSMHWSQLNSLISFGIHSWNKFMWCQHALIILSTCLLFFGVMEQTSLQPRLNSLDYIECRFSSCPLERGNMGSNTLACGMLSPNLLNYILSYHKTILIGVSPE